MEKLAPINWINIYLVNKEEIDHQHKEIINFYNYLVNLCNTNNGEKVVDMLSTRFIPELEKHFETEKAVMASLGYSGRENHVKQHTLILNELKCMLEMANNEIKEQMGIDIIKYMNTELINHIKEYDKNAFSVMEISSAPV
jgi:hemerythrin-like metal-binding protein